MNNIIVIILTYRSPFGTIPEFVEDEIPFWNEAKNVTVISLAEGHEAHVSIGANAEAYAVCPSNSLIKKIIFLFSGLRHKRVLNEFYKILLLGSSGFFRRLLSLASFLQATERYLRGATHILSKKRIDPTDLVVLYSYWCGPSAYAAIHLNEHLFNNRFIVVTRAHGSDIYEYNQKINYLPLLRQTLESCHRIYPISKHGVGYVHDHWGCPSERIELARLGILDHFSGCYPKRKQWFHIVSCSYVTAIKRVHLIAEALSGIKRENVCWTHIGGGPGLAELRILCTRLLYHKPNIRHDLRGSLPHERVINIFRTENINLLLNVSISEGIPVSMIEAQCSGIPVLGPPVGGIREIVEHGVNGRLLPHNFSIEDIRKEILLVLTTDNVQYEQLCLNARQKWLERFSAYNNYPKFTKSIFQLCEINKFQLPRSLYNENF